MYTIQKHDGNNSDGSQTRSIFKRERGFHPAPCSLWSHRYLCHTEHGGLLGSESRAKQRAFSAERSARLNQLAAQFSYLRQVIFRQMAARQFHWWWVEASSKLIIVKEYLLDSDAALASFTRLGWHNPQQQFPRGEVTKVGYRLGEETPDAVARTDITSRQEAVITLCLDEVETWSSSSLTKRQWG